MVSAVTVVRPFLRTPPSLYILLPVIWLVIYTTGCRMARNFGLPGLFYRVSLSPTCHPDCRIRRNSHRSCGICSCQSCCGCCFRTGSGCYSGNGRGCCSGRGHRFRCERGFCCCSETDSDLLFFSFWTFLCSFPVHILFSCVTDVPV